MTIDRLANMLSSIKNAAMVQKPSIEVVHTKVCEDVSKVLKTRGFVKNVKIFKPEGKSFKMLHIDFEYDGTNAILEEAKLLSKPGHRVYKGYSELRRVAAGYGVQVVSTSRGIMSSEEAKKKKLGGEVICEVR